MRRRMGSCRGTTVRVWSMRRSVRRRAVMRLERDREIRRLEIGLGSCEIRGQGQMLRVVLVLAGLRTGWTVARQSIEGFELLGCHRRCVGRWREVVRAGSDYSRGWLGVRADRRVAVRYPVRRTWTVVGCRAAAVTVHGGAAEVQVRGRRQMMVVMRMVVVVVIGEMMVAAASAAGVRRCPPRVRVRLDGGTPGDWPIGALGMSAG